MDSQDRAPSAQIIQDEANRVATILGGGVHVQVASVMFALEARFPDLSDDEHDLVRAECCRVVGEIRRNALRRMWN
jgi:hypothetical protein